jgi:hypothetical protein
LKANTRAFIIFSVRFSCARLDYTYRIERHRHFITRNPLELVTMASMTMSASLVSQRLVARKATANRRTRDVRVSAFPRVVIEGI